MNDIDCRGWDLFTCQVVMGLKISIRINPRMAKLGNDQIKTYLWA